MIYNSVYKEQHPIEKGFSRFLRSWMKSAALGSQKTVTIKNKTHGTIQNRSCRPGQRTLLHTPIMRITHKSSRSVSNTKSFNVNKLEIASPTVLLK